MKKFLKYTAMLLVSFIILTVLAVIGFIVLINPNAYKPMIASKLKSYINRDVTINGDLSWTFFPNLGVKAQSISISNPPEHKQKMVTEIANTTIDVKLLPLLHKRLEILGIDMTGVNLIWADQSVNKSYEIKNAEFHAKNLTVTGYFPVSVQFDFQPTKSAKLAHIDLNGHIMVDTTNQILMCDDLNGSVANIPIVGNLKISNLFIDPLVVSHLSVKSFNLKQTLKVLGQDTESIQQAKNAQGNIDISAGKDGTNVQGSFTIDVFQISDLKMTNMNIHPHFQKGVLDLSPITAVFYEGTLQSQMKIDFNKPQPILFINTKLNNIQAEPLMHDVGSKDQKISVVGLGNIDFQVTSTGTDSKTMLHSLNGSGRFNFKNGWVTGIDLSQLINSAYALENKQSTSSQKTDKTNFDNLTGTMNIRNGDLQNDDLLLESPSFETKGRGRVDLPGQWVNYLLYTTIKKHSADEKNDWKNLYGIALPIAIRGKLKDPSVSLDAGELLKAIAEKQLNNTSKQDVKEQLKEQIKQNAPAAIDLLQKLIK